MEPAKYLEGRSRETAIRRDTQGRWFHEGQPLEHPNLIRSFDRWIERAEDGRYCLKNDINWAYITLEGPPMFVRSLRENRDGVRLLLSNDREEALVPETLRQDGAGALHCDVAGGTLVARFDRHAQTQLEHLLGEDERGVYVTVNGERFRPPTVQDPLAAHGAGSAA